MAVNRTDRELIRNAHRIGWERIKRQTGRHSVSDIPGFRSSLVSLLEQGYCCTEMSIMFGVTRERMRQWQKRLGIRELQVSKRGPTRRVWDDATGRFRPISIGDYQRLARQRTEIARRKHIRERRSEVRRTHIRFIVSFNAKHGVGPRLHDLEREFNQPWPAISQYWRILRNGKPNRSYSEIHAVMFRAAGVELPPWHDTGSLQAYWQARRESVDE